MSASRRIILSAMPILPKNERLEKNVLNVSLCVVLCQVPCHVLCQVPFDVPKCVPNLAGLGRVSCFMARTIAFSHRLNWTRLSEL